MIEFGPQWQLAEFNVFHYMSYCAAPFCIGLGIVARSRKLFWIAVIVAAAITFASSWYAIEMMWAVRRDVAATPSENAVVERVVESGQTNALMIAALRTILFTTIWCLPGRWVWSLIDNQKLPVQRRRLERGKLV